MTILSALLLTANLLAPGGAVRVRVPPLLVPQRVDILSPTTSLTLPSGGTLRPGSRLRVERAGEFVVASTGEGWRWSGAALELGGPGVRLEIDVRGRDRRQRTLSGPLEIASRGGSLRIIASMTPEDLVASAVAAELENATEPAALEAAAIVLRSYILASVGRHRAEGYDFCDTTHCFLSRGAPPPNTRAGRAAAAAAWVTRGGVLEHGGRIVIGYCTACCGGQTTTPSALWGVADAGGYTAVACAACARSPFWRWRRSVRIADVQAGLEALLARPIGPAVELSTVSGPGGWVRWVVVREGSREARVEGDAFRMEMGRRLGWNAFPSPRFAVARTQSGFDVRGGGHGHGIGLCIAGSVALARAGATRDEILTRYFPQCGVVAKDKPQRR